MKEKELRENSICCLCNKPIGSSGLPLFWTVKVERHGIKMDVVRRQDGLTAMLGGNAMLAQVMGADENMTETMLGPINLTLCESCAMESDIVAQAFIKAEELEGGDAGK